MTRPANPLLDAIVAHDGDIWRILETGVTNDDGLIYCALASTTRGRHQKNGFYPLQICDFLDVPAAIAAAAR